MECPWCTKDLDIPDVVIINMESYREPVLSKTYCCGKGVRLMPRFSFIAYPYEGEQHEDDWGADIRG